MEHPLPPAWLRTRRDRGFRKRLRRILDAHDAYKNQKLVRHARALLTTLRFRQVVVGDVMGWYLSRKLSEESFARRSFMLPVMSR
jgi:hypothetical protein